MSDKSDHTVLPSQQAEQSTQDKAPLGGPLEDRPYVFAAAVSSLIDAIREGLLWMAVVIPGGGSSISQLGWLLALTYLIRQVLLAAFRRRS